MTDKTAAIASRYAYDPLGRLASRFAAEQPVSQRFYRGQQLISERQGDTHLSLVRTGSQLLGHHVSGAEPQRALIATDGQQSVLAVSSERDSASFSYSAYGEQGETPATRGYPAFNGQRREEDTGWYLLGNGYRAFNPALHRFHNPDSFSPFNGAGVNPYMYCSGDPINFSDPTGHLSSSGWASIGVGLAFTVLGIAITALSGGSATGAYAASVSSVLSVTAAIGSAATGAAAVVLGESSDQQGAAQVLGWISMGLGILSAHQAGAARPPAQNGRITTSAMPERTRGLYGTRYRIQGSSLSERAARFDALKGNALSRAVKDTPGRILHELADSSVVRAARMFPHLKDIRRALRPSSAYSLNDWVRHDAHALNTSKNIAMGRQPGLMPFQLNEAGIRATTLPAISRGTLFRRAPTFATFQNHVSTHIDEIFRTRDSYLF